jgi:acetyl-CoA acyltransferase
MPGRVAIVAGCRTPFARAGSVYRDLTAIDLAKACVRELIERSEIDPAWVETVAMGQVIASPKAPNLAREVVLGAGLPVGTPAHTVNRACASASQAIADVAESILAGHATCGIAGGAESLSDPPILLGKGLRRALLDASRAKSPGDRLRPFLKLRPRDLAPDAPAIAEPSTGLTMGESAEKMAKENGVTREEQDGIALRSHLRAAAAMDDGRIPAELVRVFIPPAYEDVVESDNLVRRDTSADALAALPTVFDRKYGSVTAGNSSPLTDGAAAVLLMEEARAEALGYEPLAFLRAWAVAAVDPAGQLLMGPALAVPKALERAGITLADVDLVEMHEAFAAQVASNLRSIGTVEPERLNVMGGSIAIGHPFGATGARLATTLANEMKRRRARFGLISVCAQGGMGFAMVLER